METQFRQMTRADIFRLVQLICILLCGTIYSVADTGNTNTAVSIQAESIANPGSYFYSDLLPIHSPAAICVLCSCQPFSTQPIAIPGVTATQVFDSQSRNKTPNTWRLALHFWEINKDTKSSIGILPIDGYDFARNIPIVVTTEEDTYVFFLSNINNIVPEMPIAHRTPGGWIWQRLDCIPAAIKVQAQFYDIDNGMVYDATGKCLAVLSKFKTILPGQKDMISIECRHEGNNYTGLVGHIAPYQGEHPFLPYDSLYLYSLQDEAKNSEFVKLGTVKDGAVFDPDNPTLAGKATPAVDDVVTYGKPVSEGTHIFYWYCIQPKDRPTYRVYILADNNGTHTSAIDGYIVNPPYVRYWQDNAWRKEERQLNWDYQQQLGLIVQPIVGKDANNNILSYRPPNLWEIKYVTGVDDIVKQK